MLNDDVVSIESRCATLFATWRQVLIMQCCQSLTFISVYVPVLIKLSFDMVQVDIDSNFFPYVQK